MKKYLDVLGGRVRGLGVFYLKKKGEEGRGIRNCYELWLVDGIVVFCLWVVIMGFVFFWVGLRFL